MLLNDFYHIETLKLLGGEVLADITLNSDHEIYGGHFPGNPVVPGVCLMTITKEVLIEAIGTKLVLAEAKSLKFLGVVNPHKQASLKVEIKTKGRNGSSISVNCLIFHEETVVYKASCRYTVLSGE